MPFEVPEGWCWCKVTEVLTKLTDGTHHSPTSAPTGDFKYVTAKNIKPWGIDLSDITYVDKATHDEIYNRCNPEIGDILYIKDGATTGVACVNDLNEPFSLLSSVALLKPSKQISNRFLLAYLQSSICYDTVRESMKGVGITRITLKIIENWDIPLPPYHEQEKIADSVELWMREIDMIETNSCNIKLYVNSLKSKILDLAIHGKLVPQDDHDEPASELLKRINPKAVSSCDNPHYANVPFVLPSNWVWVKLGDITNYGKCTTYPVDDIDNNSWVLELEDIEKDTGKVLVRQTKAEREIKGVRHSFSSGNILYSKLRTYLNKVLLANEDGFCTTEIIPIECTDAVYSQYLCCVLRSQYFLDYTIQCGYGVKMPRLSTSDARKASIPLPPYKEQVKISRKVNELMKALDSIAETLG